MKSRGFGKNGSGRDVVSKQKSPLRDHRWPETTMQWRILYTSKTKYTQGKNGEQIGEAKEPRDENREKDSYLAVFFSLSLNFCVNFSNLGRMTSWQ